MAEDWSRMIEQKVTEALKNTKTMREKQRQREKEWTTKLCHHIRSRIWNMSDREALKGKMRINLDGFERTLDIVRKVLVQLESHQINVKASSLHYIDIVWDVPGEKND